MKKKKDEQMGKFGKKGYKGLILKLGSPEAVHEHYVKLSKRRWKLHPEQRAGMQKKLAKKAAAK